MPAGNDGRASRRPMPRQLDMSGLGADSSFTSTQDCVRSKPTASRDYDGFQYSKPNEQTGSFKEDAYRQRQLSTRKAPPIQQELTEPRSRFSGFPSERDATSKSSSDAAFTSVTTNNDYTRDATHKSGQRIHDNQHEGDDLSLDSNYKSFDWRQQDHHMDSENKSTRAVRQENKHEWSDTGVVESPDYSRAAHHFSARSSSSVNLTRFDTRPRLSTEKADSIRAAESPVPSRIESPLMSSTRTSDQEPTRKAPEIRISPFSPGYENQDAPPSPTNSETSNSPSSPDSDCDSTTQRIRNRYPKPSIPSPTYSGRPEERKSLKTVSPCSSVSTSKSSTRKDTASAPRTKQYDAPKQGAQSAMSDLREDLYAFRKQMREVFIRVEDMIDVHRSFFKSDPSTGSPVFNADLQQEAEQLATQAFEQLADLRKQFAILASDFQRSEKPSDGWPRRGHDQTKTRAPITKLQTRLDRAKTFTSSHTSSHTPDADEGISATGSVISDDDGSDRDSSDREHSSRIPLTRHSSQVDSDDDAPPATMPDSVRSTASTYISSQLQSRWGKSSKSTAASDISARISRSRGRSPSIVSDARSLPDQCSRTSELQADSIFQDFDKRMEEIRCSLNAIASGKKPHRSSNTDSAARVAASPPKIFTRGDAASPVRARMDAARTRSTLREASRISTAGLNAESSTTTNSSQAKPPRGAREAELRQLLQQLNQLNADNDADD